MAGDAAPKRKPRLVPTGGAGVQPEDIDRVIHERVRLGIVSALAGSPSMSFVELKHALGITDGNLSVHARRLEEAGYVECKKGYVDRVPKTEFRLTAKGRVALARYLDHMEALIRAMRGR